MDLPYDDWADLSAVGMRLLSVHMPRGGCCLAVFDAARDQPEGMGIAAHAERLKALDYHTPAVGPSGFWFMHVDFLANGLTHRWKDPDVGALIDAFPGSRPTRFSRDIHHVDKSGRDPATLPGRQEQAFRDLYLRALSRMRSTMTEMALAGEIPHAGDPGSVLSWEQAVGAMVAEMPAREARSMVGVRGGTATMEEIRQAVSNGVRWRLEGDHLRQAWLTSALPLEGIKEFALNEHAAFAASLRPQ